MRLVTYRSGGDRLASAVKGALVGATVGCVVGGVSTAVLTLVYAPGWAVVELWVAGAILWAVIGALLGYIIGWHAAGRTSAHIITLLMAIVGVDMFVKADEIADWTSIKAFGPSFFRVGGVMFAVFFTVVGIRAAVNSRRK